MVFWEEGVCAGDLFNSLPIRQIAFKGGQDGSFIRTKDMKGGFLSHGKRLQLGYYVMGCVNIVSNVQTEQAQCSS